MFGLSFQLAIAACGLSSRLENAACSLSSQPVIAAPVHLQMSPVGKVLSLCCLKLECLKSWVRKVGETYDVLKRGRKLSNGDSKI